MDSNKFHFCGLYQWRKTSQKEKFQRRFKFILQPSSSLPAWFYCLVDTHKLASFKKKNLLLLLLMKESTLSQKCDYLVPHKFKMCEKREGIFFQRISFYHILKCCSFVNDGQSGASKSNEI